MSRQRLSVIAASDHLPPLLPALCEFRAASTRCRTVVSLTDTLAEQAAELRARHPRLRLPGAIVLATAQEMGGSLLSYDRRLSQLAVRLV
jgi:predicted nucleic acid-binding protein